MTKTKIVIAVLGVDLGKNSCSLAGLDATGAIVLRRRMTRDSLLKFIADLPSCVVAMEACCGANFIGRAAAEHGHEVRLMSPEYVQPYVKAQKTDDRDAEAIAEAASRPTMRFVPLKSESQLDLQAVHRARQRLVAVTDPAHQPATRAAAGARHYDAEATRGSAPEAGGART